MEAIERATGARDKMKYRNKILTFPDGRQFLALSRKPTADPKRFIYLMRSRDKKQDSLDQYSLWNFEFLLDEEGNIDMWPYDGEDSNDLIRELLKDYVKHGFEVD